MKSHGSEKNRISRAELHRLATAGSLCVGLLLSLGCDEPDGRRTLAYPRLDPCRAFPEFRPVRQEPGRDLTQDVATATIGGESGGGGEAKCWENASAPLTPYSLGQRFQADLPSGWREAASGQVTLLVHRQNGDLPDAFVVAQPFTSPEPRHLSLEARRFQRLIDVELGKSPWLRAVTASATRAVKEGAGEEAAAAFQDQLGPGAGFRSEGSFQGWKWVGRLNDNSDLPTFRLGRSYGRWSRLPGSSGEAAASGTNSLPDSSPAYVIYGSIGYSPSYGLHLAIVCAAAPTCAVAADLARMLHSLRPLTASGEGAGAVGGEQEFRRLAEQVGLQVEVPSAPLADVPSSDAPPPADTATPSDAASPNESSASGSVS